MIHHACAFRENDFDGPLGASTRKPTMAGVDETGQLRCCACGRKVCEPDGTTHHPNALKKGAALVEGPHPSGWCSDPPEVATATVEDVLNGGVP